MHCPALYLRVSLDSKLRCQTMRGPSQLFDLVVSTERRDGLAIREAYDIGGWLIWMVFLTSRICLPEERNVNNEYP